MYKFTPVVYTLRPGTPAEHVNGIVGDGRAELNMANKLLSKCGESRFSLVAFGNYLHDAAATDEERDKVLLAFMYYVNSLSGEDTDRGRLAAKLMNTARYHGYVT